VLHGDKAHWANALRWWETVDGPAWDAAHLPGHRLVAREVDGQVVGWTALAVATVD
jgi:hypothetical protein